MKIYRIDETQVLPITLEQAWEFFSNPGNLQDITPEWLNFEITSPVDAMYPGQIITYRIKPILNIPTTWVTEIAQVREPYFFIDEQRFGPYRFWHHQHHFKAVEAGVEVRDVVHYGLPLGPIGQLTNRLLVGKRLHHVFAYRKQALIARFGEAQ